MAEGLRIAILGATGHVGKCLSARLRADSAVDLTLVARDLARLGEFTETLRSLENVPRQITFDDFPNGEYDAIINCVGFSNPAALPEASGESVFSLTERFDQIALGYLARSPETRYVSFSSGAAYGGGFDEPASEATPALFPANRLGPQDFYGLAKIASEAKHRALSHLAIVDLRLFGLYSRHIDPQARYFMNDVFNAIGAGERLNVGQEDIRRDYVGPGDLTALVLGVLRSPNRNDVFDVYSAAPASKFEILENFAERYGLAYDVDESRKDGSPTGAKLNYYSTNKHAEEIGYTPRQTTLETLRIETDARLAHQEGAVT